MNYKCHKLWSTSTDVNANTSLLRNHFRCHCIHTQIAQGRNYMRRCTHAQLSTYKHQHENIHARAHKQIRTQTHNGRISNGDMIITTYIHKHTCTMISDHLPFGDDTQVWEVNARRHKLHDIYHMKRVSSTKNDEKKKTTKKRKSRNIGFSKKIRICVCA